VTGTPAARSATDGGHPPAAGAGSAHQQGGVELAPVAGPADWEASCAAFAEATAFHRYDFLAAVAPAVRCRFVPLQVWHRGQAVGVAPLLVKRLGPFCTINWVPFPYLGPLVPATLLPDTLSALRAEARRRRAVGHQQSFSRLVPSRSDSGFGFATDRSFVTSLSNRSEEDLLAAMDNKRRQAIRRAQRLGYEVGPARRRDFGQVDAWIAEVYAAQGMRDSYRAGTLERVFAELGDTAGSAFHAARLGGQTVGMAAILATARRAFFWQVAIDPSHRPEHPQELLTWHALRWARDAGLDEFDLVGAPTEGIATYKRRFGAVERHYTVLSRQAAARRAALAVLSRLRPGPAPRLRRDPSPLTESRDKLLWLCGGQAAVVRQRPHVI
jgi:CelD/BcsL family acetyltransferase involved in cellulose biosynthesis